MKETHVERTVAREVAVTREVTVMRYTLPFTPEELIEQLRGSVKEFAKVPARSISVDASHEDAPGDGLLKSIIFSWDVDLEQKEIER